MSTLQLFLRACFFSICVQTVISLILTIIYGHALCFTDTAGNFESVAVDNIFKLLVFYPSHCIPLELLLINGFTFAIPTLFLASLYAAYKLWPAASNVFKNGNTS